MKRLTQHLVAGGLAASTLGLAAAMFEAAPAAQARGPSALADTRMPSLIDTLVLHRWGYGALDWLLPDDPQGDRNGRDRPRRD